MLGAYWAKFYFLQRTQMYCSGKTKFFFLNVGQPKVGKQESGGNKITGYFSKVSNILS